VAGAGIASTVVRSMMEEARKGIPAGAVAAPLMGAMQGPAEDPAARDARMQARTKVQLDRVQQTSAALSQFAFGLSSATGIMSAFGMDLNGILPVISGVTGALFGLISITQALAASQAAATVANKINLAGGGLSGITSILTSFKGGATGLKGFFNILKGVSGAFKSLFPIIGKLIGPLSIIIGVLSVGKFLFDLYQDGQRKLRGLSDAADMSAEQIKKLGEAAGAQSVLEKASFKTEDTSAAQAAPLAASDKTGAEGVIEKSGGMDEFRKEYSNQIKAIEDAKGDQQRLLALYSSMAIQFSALGIEGPALENIINALKMGAGEKDVVLDFKTLSIFDEAGNIDISAIQKRAQISAQIYRDAYQPLVNGRTTDTSIMVQAETIAATTGELKSLRAAFEAGTITQADYQAATTASIAPLKEVGDASDNLTKLLQDMEIDPGTVNGLETIAEKTAVLNAALAGIDVTEFAEGLKSTDINTKSKAFTALAAATADATKEQEAANVSTNFENAVSPIQEQITALEQQIEVYDDVVAATGDTALAQQIAGDESLRAAYTAALAADVLAKANGEQGVAVNQLFDDIKKLNSLNAQVSRITPGGGGQKSPFQQAIDKLQEQKKEITSNINAYAKLRNAGFGVAESSELAADSTLAVALAAQKVGSKGYNDLLQKIRQVKRAQDELADIDPQLGTDRYNEAF
jgi:hypothetical protein